MTIMAIITIITFTIIIIITFSTSIITMITRWEVSTATRRAT